MSDWEKRRPVLDAVVTCREMLNPPGYRMTDCSVDCPYYEKRAEKHCVKAMLEDMAALIRGLEPVEPKEYMSRVNRTEYLCGACDSGILYGDEFCRHCGREVKWDAAD